MSIITFGELLGRLSTPGTKRICQSNNYESSFGGSESNVAAFLANIGHDVQFVTRVPNSPIGKVSLMALHQLGIKTDFSVFGGDRLGSYYMETAASMRSSKVVYDREDSAFMTMTPQMIDWENALNNASWFHWSGIALALSQSAADTCIKGLEIAQKKGIRLSCDLNYRKNLWKYGKTYEEIVRPLVGNSEIVFGSEDEYEVILRLEKGTFNGMTIDENGKFIINKPVCESVMQKVKTLYPNVRLFSCVMRLIVSSNHHINAALIFDGKKMFYSKIYDIDNVVDCVGVGDAFAAAWIDGIIRYENDLQKIVEYGSAASAIKNTIPGDFNLVSKEEIENLMNGNTNGRVQR